MKLALILVVITALLIVLGLVYRGGEAPTSGIPAGEALPGVGAPTNTPDAAVRALLGDVQQHDWDRAYSLLANPGDVEKDAFIHDLAGNYGSLRTLSLLEGSQTRVLQEAGDQAQVRTSMRWSTAVGPSYDVRDLKLVRRGNDWKIVWPLMQEAKVPPQVVPVNYLRWDVIYRGAKDDWGAQNVDSPQVRIVSMNAIQHGRDVVVMGEIVNEDTVPAYVDVNAVLVGNDGSPMALENTFDKISHTLLPKQVSPYRIDFPGRKSSDIKSVRMEPKAMLVPASADPVIGVVNQRQETNALGQKVLTGQLLNESGQTVNIAQVLATYYDNQGKVIWVSNGYVDRALLPQTPESFAVDIPEDVASKMQSYRVTVNHYSRETS